MLRPSVFSPCSASATWVLAQSRTTALAPVLDVWLRSSNLTVALYLPLSSLRTWYEAMSALPPNDDGVHRPRHRGVGGPSLGANDGWPESRRLRLPDCLVPPLQLLLQLLAQLRHPSRMPLDVLQRALAHSPPL